MIDTYFRFRCVFVHNEIVTLIGFLIYNKDWLLFSLADKQRHSQIDLTLYKNELITRQLQSSVNIIGLLLLLNSSDLEHNWS